MSSPSNPAAGPTAVEKAKLLQRLNRIRGQVEAMRRALEADQDTAAVLQRHRQVDGR